jgi:hypothetical protein
VVADRRALPPSPFPAGPAGVLVCGYSRRPYEPYRLPHPMKLRTYLGVGLHPHAVTLQTLDRGPKPSWISLGFRRPSNPGSPLAAGKISRRGTQLMPSCTGLRHPRCVLTLSCRLGLSAGRAVPSGRLPIPLPTGLPVGLSKTLDLHKRGSLRPFGPLFKLESLVERLTHDDLHASTV